MLRVIKQLRRLRSSSLRLILGARESPQNILYLPVQSSEKNVVDPLIRTLQITCCLCTVYAKSLDVERLHVKLSTIVASDPALPKARWDLGIGDITWSQRILYISITGGSNNYPSRMMGSFRIFLAYTSMPHVPRNHCRFLPLHLSYGEQLVRLLL